MVCRRGAAVCFGTLAADVAQIDNLPICLGRKTQVNNLRYMYGH